MLSQWSDSAWAFRTGGRFNRPSVLAADCKQMAQYLTTWRDVWNFPPAKALYWSGGWSRKEGRYCDFFLCCLTAFFLLFFFSLDTDQLKMPFNPSLPSRNLTVLIFWKRTLLAQLRKPPAAPVDFSFPHKARRRRKSTARPCPPSSPLYSNFLNVFLFLSFSFFTPCNLIFLCLCVWH